MSWLHIFYVSGGVAVHVVRARSGHGVDVDLQARKPLPPPTQHAP